MSLETRARQLHARVKFRDFFEAAKLIADACVSQVRLLIGYIHTPILHNRFDYFQAENLACACENTYRFTKQETKTREEAGNENNGIGKTKSSCRLSRTTNGAARKIHYSISAKRWND